MAGLTSPSLARPPGKGWENHVEGQKLKGDSDSFRVKLNTAEIFDDWAKKVQARNLGVSGRIFTIETQRSRSGKGNLLKLKVNFLPEIITLSKEVGHVCRRGNHVGSRSGLVGNDIISPSARRWVPPQQMGEPYWFTQLVSWVTMRCSLH